MKEPWLMSLFSTLHILNTCTATPPPAPSYEYQELVRQPNLTYPAFPSAFPNRTTVDPPEDRYYVPETNIALDFYHQEPSIPGRDVLMALIEGLAQVFGHAATEPLPGLSTFHYKRNAFVHIQDLNPTPGRVHTYGDMAATLRGVGEYMTAYNKFYTTGFQIWAISPSGRESKIGSGGVGGGSGFQGTAAVDMGLPPATSGASGAVGTGTADVNTS